MDRLDASSTETDFLDGALHDILMKRMELAALRPGAAMLRPAREAALLRVLARRHGGDLSFISVARVFREILSAPLALEVHVFTPEDPVGAVELARAHFGSLATLNRAGSAVSVLERVRAHAGAVGLMPSPSAAGEKWWLRLMGGMDGAPRVVARLPALEPEGLDAAAARAFVVACLPCEPSGEDGSLLAIEASATVSPSAVERALTGCGFKSQLLDRASERGRAVHLFEVAGFLTEPDALRANAAPIERVHLIGTFPLALTLPLAKPPQAAPHAGDIDSQAIRPGAP
jgi:chorismate mutase